MRLLINFIPLFLISIYLLFDACFLEFPLKMEEENKETKVDDTIITEEQLYKDAQLKSAVDILKALIITNKGKK